MKNLVFLSSLILIMVLGCNQSNLKTEPDDEIISSDPLPSWKDGGNKSAIIDFVKQITQQDGANYVRPEERIATFDNDGTLWCEQPVVQMEFIIYQIQKMAPEHPEWKKQLPYKAILEGDKSFLINDLINNHGLEVIKLVTATHTGMTSEEFNLEVEDFFNATQHPKFNKKYTQTSYQPMIELLQYLRKNEFKTFICSGGGTDFMRVFAEDVYGIVPENTIGSFAINTYEEVDGLWKIVKGKKNFFMCDKEDKPVAIEQRIGRIPIFVAGNVRSGGDIGQLTYSKTNQLPNFQLLINHDDDVREFAYSEEDNSSLNAAKEGNWHVISMKNDWLKIFPFDN